MSKNQDPDLTDEADEILGRADAFMRRRRSAPDPSHVDDDIPLLTDIVPLSVPRSALNELSDPAVFQRPHRGPEAEPTLERSPPPPPLPQAAPAPAPAATQRPPVPVAAPDPARIEELVAARLQEALGEYRQEMAIALDDWLNFDLPRLVSREIDGIADRVVKKAGEELRILLQAGLPPDE